MRPGLLSIATALFALSPVLAQARIIVSPTPEDMERRATLVCNAVVEFVKKTNPIPNPHGMPQVRMEVRLKILHVFKGTAPAEITYYYRAWSGNVPPNTPIFELTKNTRYRFFLVPGTPQSDFTDTEFNTQDELFGIEPLSPGEPDDSPPLERDEAIRLALAAVHLTPNDLDAKFKVYIRTSPELPPMEYDGHNVDTTTEVQLTDKHGGSHRVVILGDRSIGKVGN